MDVQMNDVDISNLRPSIDKKVRNLKNELLRMQEREKELMGELEEERREVRRLEGELEENRKEKRGREIWEEVQGDVQRKIQRLVVENRELRMEVEELGKQLAASLEREKKRNVQYATRNADLEIALNKTALSLKQLLSRHSSTLSQNHNLKADLKLAKSQYQRIIQSLLSDLQTQYASSLYSRQSSAHKLTKAVTQQLLLQPDIIPRYSHSP